MTNRLLDIRPRPASSPNNNAFQIAANVTLKGDKNAVRQKLEDPQIRVRPENQQITKDCQGDQKRQPPRGKKPFTLRVGDSSPITYLNNDALFTRIVSEFSK